VGVLTDATMRLQKEMAALRQVRVALRSDLVRQTGELRTRVSALCAGFASDRAGAHRVWFGPTLFEGQAAARHPQRRPAEDARAKAPADEPPLATPKAKPRRHSSAKPVSAAAARARVAPLRSTPKPHSKRSKKH
jgi:hypothetical protein